MAESVPAGAGDVALRAAWARWAYSLLWCAPAIFVIGAGTLVATRVLFAINYPERYNENVVSISETISRYPGSTVFQSASIAIAFCILVCWPLNFTMNRYRFGHLAHSGGSTWLLEGLNLASCVTGMAAGVFLVLLGLYRLHDGSANHALHIELSIFYYSSQVIAFLFDGACVVLQRKRLTGLDGAAERRSFKSRGIIAGATTVTALWFLYMYLDRSGLFDLYIGQAIYVATEYTLVLLFLAYPMAPFIEARRHYAMRTERLSGENPNARLTLAEA